MMSIAFIEGKQLAALLRGCASNLGACSLKALLTSLKACVISEGVFIAMKQSELVPSSMTCVHLYCWT